jgi:hypothetical protein
MSGPALCAVGVLILAASLAVSDRPGSDRLDNLCLVLAVIAGACVAVGILYLVF